jgi:hypothetical protein
MSPATEMAAPTSKTRPQHAPATYDVWPQSANGSAVRKDVGVDQEDGRFRKRTTPRRASK